MKDLQHLIDNNAAWAKRIKSKDPQFFAKLARKQTPQYLWIGCSDSRVPASQVIDLPPGEVFVHRNIGNIVVDTDLNCLAVIQFAVQVLRVRHIIVCGHYGCGGIHAALENRQCGLIDKWLSHIQNIYSRHAAQLEHLSFEDKWARLARLNVIEQVCNVCNTAIVQNTWHAGRALSVHGWIYSLSDGTIDDLNVSVSSMQALGAGIRTC